MRALVICLSVLVVPFPAAAQQVGPAKGSLVIAGGGLRDLSIIRRFLDLAGGPQQPIVVIPTAGEADVYYDTWDGLRQFREAGATNLSVLHTRDRKMADTEPSAHRSARRAASGSAAAASGVSPTRTCIPARIAICARCSIAAA